MGAFLIANAATIGVCTALAAAVAGSVRWLLHRRREAACTHCTHCGRCRK